MKRKNDAKINGSKVLKEMNPVTETLKENECEDKPDVPPSFHYSDNKKSLYRPPTSEEINSLKETENLFQSSMLHMQINELLSEVCIKKKKKKLEETLHSLNELLMSLPDGEEQDVTNLSWLPDRIHIPLPPLHGPAKGTFQFHTPKSVRVIGSYLLGTLCKPHLNIDIAVQLPQECIHGKDYLNFRYYYKRGLYLAILASYIRKSKLFKKVEFSLHNRDLWKPILVLTPKGKACGMFTIKVFITLPTNAFKLHRFSPKINNVRHHWFYKKQEAKSKESDVGTPTPHYNCSILIDMLLEQHLHFLHCKISQSQSILDAIVLCKVWLFQRQLNEGFQGFTGFHVSMVIAYLLQTHQVNQHMSSYQIVRIFWQFLVSKDLTNDGISMVDQTNVVDDHMPSVIDFHDWFEVVLVDSSGYLNLLANMTKMTMKQLSQEAKLALEFLDSQSTYSFDAVFMKRIHFITRFDDFFHLKDISVLKTVIEKQQLKSELVDRAGDWIKVGLSWLESLLQKALGNRIDLFALQPETSPLTWSLKEEPPLASQQSVTVGFILNLDNVANILEKGPSANDIEAKAFREFWGEKSELRRFQDGTISEAVVWTCGNASEKRRICEQIIKHILNRHAGIDPSQIIFTSNKLESLLQQGVMCSSKTKKKEVSNSATGEEEIQTVIRTFESLGKQLRSLNLPLSVNSIQGLSPVLRGTEVYPAVPRFISQHDIQDDRKKELTIPLALKTSPPWCPATEVLVMFETSGHWPDDIDAIQRIKAAFLLKIARLLRSECHLPAVANTKHVDVLKDGYAFRIKLGHYREMVLFQQSSETSPLKQFHDDNAKILKREILLLPMLSSTIHGIQQQYSSFGGSVRLAKRWISSQMLIAFFTEECIELIIAHLYLNPSPYIAPGSPTVGFLRFLLLLSTFDWANNPLIVNFNSEMTRADYQEIQSHFSTNRVHLPAMFIATPKDKLSSYWTKDNPSLMILRRMTVLAKEAFAVLHVQLAQYSDDSIDLKQIFRAPVEDYDVIITLHSKYNPRFYQAVDSTKVLAYQTNSSLDMVLPVVNFDPVVCYLNELKESFSEIALFFHDTYGGDIIGVVWKPSVFETSQFKVLHSQYCVPVGKVEQNESLVAPNMKAILSDFKILGEGLVKEIKTKNAAM